jgi:hypothetical protein
MILPLTLLLWAHGSPAFGPEDLERFPGTYDAWRQRLACEEHLKRLERRRLTGGDSGRVARWERQTRWMLRYWVTLEACHDTRDPETKLGHLRDLHELLGRPLYLEGWRPPLLPLQDPEP